MNIMHDLMEFLQKKNVGLIFKGDLQGGKSHNNGGQGYFKERFGTSLFKLPFENAFRVQTKAPDHFYSYLNLNQEPITEKILEDWTHQLTE